jgi:hypothetical protein
MRNLLRGLGAATVAIAAMFVIGQGGDSLTKKAKAPVQAPAGPLSLAELQASIDRAETAVRRVVLMNSQPVVVRKVSQDRPAKRQEIVAEFSRLFEMARPHFKFTPTPVRYDAKLLSLKPEEPARKQVETLIRFGFVGRIAPMATASVPTMTLEEFGDALGFFLARMGEVTHTPSSKWSPYMFGHKDAPP